MTLIFPIAAAFLGLLFGSFIATLVLRWPEGRSVLRGRSACDGCGVILRPHELLPLASYVLAHGKCRHCSAKINALHWQVELAGAVIGALSLTVAPDFVGWSGALFGWLMLTLALLDLRHFWLPDRLSGLVAGSGLIAGLVGLTPDLADRIIGGVAGYGSLALIALAYRLVRKREGIGGGDPKLFGAIGLWLGWQALPMVLLTGSLGGLIWAGCLVLRGARIAATDRLPLGTLLAIAGFGAWLCQNQNG